MKPRTAAFHARPRDYLLARRAKRAGAKNYALRIIIEAKRHRNVSASLALALIEQESGFRNVFGHDAGGLFPGQEVTAAKVHRLLGHIAGGGTSNGVGPAQLTWPDYIREAQRDGGAHKTSVNIATGLRILAANIAAESGSERNGLARYNAGSSSSSKGQRYAAQVLDRKHRFHRALT
jgi:hypothetical protein